MIGGAPVPKAPAIPLPERPTHSVGDLLILCGFVILTAGLTYPLVWHLSDSLPGFPPEDNFHYLWELWYPAHAIFERHTSPFVDPYIYSPFGFDLILNQDLSPATVLLFAPVTFLLGEVVTYNLIVLMSFPLTAFGTYLLCRELWGSRLAAIVAGTIAGFCTYRVTHALGHLSIVTTQWIPFFLYYVERSVSHPTPRNGVLAGVFYSLSALVTWYYAVGCAVAALVYLSVRLTTSDRRPRELVRPAAAAIFVTLVLVTPFIVPYARVVVSGEMTSRPVAEQAMYSASLADFFIPAVSHPLWGRAVSQLWRTRGNGEWLAEWQVYLGIVPLVLALVGMRAPRTRTVWAVIAVGVTTLIIALGPLLQPTHASAGGPAIASWIWRIPLPVRVVALVPPFSLLRAWSRMAFFVEIAVALLAARGLLLLLQRPPRVISRWPLVWRVALTAAALALTTVDTLAVPYARSSVQPRPVDIWLSTQPGDFATVEFPILGDGWSGPTMYRRRVTGKRTVLGYGRHPPNEDFWPMLSRFPATESLDLLRWWGVRYVLVDEARYRSGADFWGVRHTWQTLQPAMQRTGRLLERATLNDVHVYELQPAVDRSVGDELLTNPGFEEWTEGTPIAWTRIGSRDDAVLIRSAHRGRWAVEVTPQGYFVSSKIPVVPGRCYEVQQVNRGNGGHAEVRLQVNWLDESGRDLGPSAALLQMFNASSTWRRARAAGLAPLASRSARVYAVAHRGRVGLDDLSFREVMDGCADLGEPSHVLSIASRDTPTLTAAPNPVPSTLGPGRTTLAWSTGKEPPGQIYLSENGGPEVLFAGLSGYGSQEATWIDDGKTYEFRLYSGQGRERRLASVVVTSKREPFLVATPNPVPAGSEPGKTELRWSTADGTVGEIFVSIDNGPEILFARDPQGLRQANWIRAGSAYVFRLYRIGNPRTLLASVDVRPARIAESGHGP